MWNSLRTSSIYPQFNNLKVDLCLFMFTLHENTTSNTGKVSVILVSNLPEIVHFGIINHYGIVFQGGKTNSGQKTALFDCSAGRNCIFVWTRLTDVNKCCGRNCRQGQTEEWSLQSYRKSKHILHRYLLFRLILFENCFNFVNDICNRMFQIAENETVRS